MLSIDSFIVFFSAQGKISVSFYRVWWAILIDNSSWKFGNNHFSLLQVSFFLFLFCFILICCFQSFWTLSSEIRHFFPNTRDWFLLTRTCVVLFHEFCFDWRVNIPKWRKNFWNSNIQNGRGWNKNDWLEREKWNERVEDRCGENYVHFQQGIQFLQKYTSRQVFRIFQMNVMIWKWMYLKK